MAQDYQQQRLLYEQYGTSKVLKKLFAQGPTAYNRQRLKKELESLVISKQSDGNDPNVTTIPPAPLNDIDIVGLKAPDNLLEQVLQQIRPLMDRRTLLHGQMSSRQISIKERGKLAFEILAISDKLTPLWATYNHVKEHGTLPAVKQQKVVATGSADQHRRLTNLRSQRSRLKNRPDRLLDYQSICAEIKAIEEALKHGN